MKTLTLWKTLHIFISDMEISSQPFSGRALLISFEVLLTPSGVSRRGKQILLPRFFNTLPLTQRGYSLGTFPAKMLVEEGAGKSVDHTCQP